MTIADIRAWPGNLYRWFGSLSRHEQITLVVAVLAIALTVIPGVVKDMTDHFSGNLYIFQAKAFLEGRTYIEEDLLDVARFEDKLYVVPSPFPAVLLLPVVAIFGPTETYTTLISVLLSAANVPVFLSILKKLDIPEDRRLWLVLAAFLGTGYWFVVLDSFGQWHFAHVVAFTTLLLAVSEALGRRRPWLMGLLLGMAVLSRPTSMFAGFFLAAALWQKSGDAGQAQLGKARTSGEEATPSGSLRLPPPPGRGRWEGRKIRQHEQRGGPNAIPSGARLARRLLDLGLFSLPVILCVAAYMYFNFIRFGSPTESGYRYVEAADILRSRVEQYGLFSWRYVPFNFAYMFLQGFHVQFDNYANPFLGMRVDPFGTSLLVASPFVLSAFLAKPSEKWSRLLTWGAWLTVIANLAYVLFYHNNGWVQSNTQRYTLDFLPALLPLVALGATRTQGRWWEWAVTYALALNVIALLLLPNYGLVKETGRALVCNLMSAPPFPCVPPPYSPPPLFFQ